MKRESFTFQWNAVQLQTVPAEYVAQPFSDLFLKTLDILIDELNHFSRIDINQMIVMLLIGRFISGHAIAELELGDDIQLGQQVDCPVDGSNRNLWIDPIGLLIEFLNAGMIR